MYCFFICLRISSLEQKQKGIYILGITGHYGREVAPGFKIVPKVGVIKTLGISQDDNFISRKMLLEVRQMVLSFTKQCN